MARTKASVGTKVASGKSSKARCSAAPSSSSSGPSGSGERANRGASGGNTVCPRETPKWQKPITNFFMCKDTSRNSDSDNDVGASSSNSKPKKQVIESDDEEVEMDKPKNMELDETIELEPLSGEDSHKIEEYYPKNGVKGKGKGKKTKDKENIDSNMERRNSVKRDLEEITFGEESEHARKRVKVD